MCERKSRRGELEALLAVQIAATGFASLKFLKLGQRHLEDAYVEVYGGYGTRLLRLQLELIQALDKHRRGRRGNKQTVEVRHVHIHPGGQGVVGIINSLKDGGSSESHQNAQQIAHAPQPAMRSPNAELELMPRAGDGERPMPDARGNVSGSTATGEQGAIHERDYEDRVRLGEACFPGTRGRCS